MKLLDLTFASPAENLACDEAMLDAGAENGGSEILRFWEARQTFVVVGYANKIASEVNVAACQTQGIPVFRRCSGGGTVLQGPGCLNYALVLRIAADGLLGSITSANQFIMERNRAAIETLFFKSEIGNRKSEILISGHTDLALDGLKFSGNSQRRKKNFLLFHGTFLLNFDLAVVGELLPMPSLEPAYRARRSHADFLTNLNISAEQVKAALQKTWSATDEMHNFPQTETQKLAAQKYSTDGWNLKF
jgi:lipoate-protein ligase A